LYGSNVNDTRFQAVSRACAELGWPAPQVVERTGSTNDDLVDGQGHGQVLVALEQTAGRGRLGRRWVSAPGDGLTFSVRLDVPGQVRAWGWIPLLAGVATADAVRAAGARDIGLKWPNDVVGGDGKVAGILSVREGSSAIVGIGINVDFAGPRPDPRAVSIAELGGRTDRDLLLAGVVAGLGAWWGRFVDAGGDAVRSGLQDAYVAQCVSVGVEVAVATPDRTWSGFAEGIDGQGHLLVREGAHVRAVMAGDVSIRH
jgi:BirA family biotin operon repressor/biotin-[acetyl-CoA-carboxylase] ligase